MEEEESLEWKSKVIVSNDGGGGKWYVRYCFGLIKCIISS